MACVKIEEWHFQRVAYPAYIIYKNIPVNIEIILFIIIDLFKSNVEIRILSIFP